MWLCTVGTGQGRYLAEQGIQRSWPIRKHDANQFAIISKSQFFVQYEF